MWWKFHAMFNQLVIYTAKTKSHRLRFQVSYCWAIIHTKFSFFSISQSRLHLDLTLSTTCELCRSLRSITFLNVQKVEDCLHLKTLRSLILLLIHFWMTLRVHWSSVETLNWSEEKHLVISTWSDLRDDEINVKLGVLKSQEVDFKMTETSQLIRRESEDNSLRIFTWKDLILEL